VAGIGKTNQQFEIQVSLQDFAQYGVVIVPWSRVFTHSNATDTIYAKRNPLSASPSWSTQIRPLVRGVVFPNQGEFTLLDDGYTYTVFRQRGENPSNADVAIAEIEFTYQVVVLAGAGTGSETFVINVQNSAGSAVRDAEVYLTSDIEGGNKVTGTVLSNSLGIVTFNVDPGTYYAWVSHPIVRFNSPQTITVVDV